MPRCAAFRSSALALNGATASASATAINNFRIMLSSFPRCYGHCRPRHGIAREPCLIGGGGPIDSAVYPQ